MRKLSNKANYIVIPDLHGQLSQYLHVERYIKECLAIDHDINVIFLGDYIDRGQAGMFEYFDASMDDDIEKHFNDIGSRQIVERLMSLEDYFIRNGIKHSFLMGNHEDSFIINASDLSSFSLKKSVDSSADYIAMYNTFMGFTRDMNLIQKTKTFFEKMPLYYADNENRLFFVHAGVNPDYLTEERAIDVYKSRKSDYLNIRERFFISTLQCSHRVIFGHTPIDSVHIDKKEKAGVNEELKIILKPDRIGLDSANYRNGYMNVLRINDSKYELVKFNATGVMSTHMIDLTQFIQ